MTEKQAEEDWGRVVWICEPVTLTLRGADGMQWSGKHLLDGGWSLEGHLLKETHKHFILYFRGISKWDHGVVEVHCMPRNEKDHHNCCAFYEFRSLQECFFSYNNAASSPPSAQTQGQPTCSPTVPYQPCIAITVVYITIFFLLSISYLRYNVQLDGLVHCHFKLSFGAFRILLIDL